MITPHGPNMKIGLKRNELVVGSRYVIKEKVRAPLPGGGLCYRHVMLVDLLSANRAIVQWDKKILGGNTMTVMTNVSCSRFLATEADWDRFPKNWCAKHRRLELDMTEIQGVQVGMYEGVVM